jgi:hypothetical protein
LIVPSRRPGGASCAEAKSCGHAGWQGCELSGKPQALGWNLGFGEFLARLIVQFCSVLSISSREHKRNFAHFDFFKFADFAFFIKTNR